MVEVGAQKSLLRPPPTHSLQGPLEHPAEPCVPAWHNQGGRLGNHLGPALGTHGVTRVPATAPSPPPAYDTSPYPTQKAVSRSRLSQEGIEPPGEPGGQGLADHKGFYVCGDNSW